MRTEKRLLLVEDDSRIRRELMDALRIAGFEVDVAVACKDARVAVGRPYELILLDLGLPDGDGLEVCRELRDAGNGVPVIVITARDAPDERVRGLDAGADDYVVKPFHVPEVVARIRNVLRRAGRSVGQGPVTCEELWCDQDARRAGIGQRELTLTPRELDLLFFLLCHPGRAWTRDQLLDRVWGPTYDGDTRTVDSHIRRLRAAVESDPGDPEYIQTVWGVGYRMKEPT